MPPEPPTATGVVLGVSVPLPSSPALLSPQLITLVVAAGLTRAAAAPVAAAAGDTGPAARPAAAATAAASGIVEPEMSLRTPM